VAISIEGIEAMRAEEFVRAEEIAPRA
jgi:hypothetical protein